MLWDPHILAVLPPAGQSSIFGRPYTQRRSLLRGAAPSRSAARDLPLLQAAGQPLPTVPKGKSLKRAGFTAGHFADAFSSTSKINQNLVWKRKYFAVQLI